MKRSVDEQHGATVVPGEECLPREASSPCPWQHRFGGGFGGLQPWDRCVLKAGHDGRHEVRPIGGGIVMVEDGAEP